MLQIGVIPSQKLKKDQVVEVIHTLELCKCPQDGLQIRQYNQQQTDHLRLKHEKVPHSSLYRMEALPSRWLLAETIASRPQLCQQPNVLNLLVKVQTA